ncbi:MAG: hypothetical protein IPP88_14105 [Betaproteobacteria bacterium]|nr:hypothetical protein [Betaproteobacteria bacterium]
MHDDGRADHGADSDGNATKAHDWSSMPSRRMAMKEMSMPGQHQDSDQGATHMQQEHKANQCDDDRFFQQ